MIYNNKTVTVKIMLLENNIINILLVAVEGHIQTELKMLSFLFNNCVEVFHFNCYTTISLKTCIPSILLNSPNFSWIYASCTWAFVK